jgi:hypothetical protein
MPEHTQAVGIFGTMPPIKFSFPPFAKVGPQFHALPRELSPPVTLAQAEAAFAIRRAEELRGGEGVTESLADALATGAPLRADSLPRPSGIATGLDASSDALRGEVKFDLDPYLGADGSIDSMIQSLLDPHGALAEKLDPAAEAAAPPERSASAAQIDPSSVLQASALDLFEENVDGPAARPSGQLTFGWRQDSGEAQASAALGAKKGGRK